MVEANNNRRRFALLGTGLLAATSLVGLGLISATPAQAIVCGYSEQIEEYSSPFQINLPIIGSVDPFGGQRQVAHYGNCADGNVRITVTTADGNSSYCVTPGDTRLGFTENDRQISGARSTGSC